MSDKNTSNPPEQEVSTEKEVSMTVAECKLSTIDHIETVRGNLRWFSDRLTTRGVKHDHSKLEPPEVELFARVNHKLKSLEYGTPEYDASLAELKPALDNHYAKNRHHPEHFAEGINGMTLLDIVEMFCDWRASTSRNKNGNLLLSIETNAKRFQIDSQLKQILINTAKMMDESDT